MGILEVLRRRHFPLSAGGVQLASVLLAAMLHNHRRIAALFFRDEVHAVDSPALIVQDVLAVGVQEDQP